MDQPPRLERLPGNPIITRSLHPSLGNNINGPSLIRVPDWIDRPLGRYYLYFGHHQGTYIRLAYAHELGGPWHIHAPGCLPLDASHCQQHLASPDVHVDDERREIRMYYHGPVTQAEREADGMDSWNRVIAGQRSKVAISRDGLTFTAWPAALGAPYFRVFRWQGAYCALGMPGVLHRSPDGLEPFEVGPVLFDQAQRHAALLLRKDRLWVFYTNAGDCPERILCAEIHLHGDWRQWRPGPPREVARPQLPWEGADAPLTASQRGVVFDHVNQLRDPATYVEDADVYLLYAAAGEQAIGMGRLIMD